MKTTNIIYTVAREGYAESFNERTIAKVVYTEWKKEYPETVLRKTITTEETLQLDDKSGLWL